MNTKRIIFWTSFIIILVLIVWGLIVAMNKPINGGSTLGNAPEVTATDHVTSTSTNLITLIEYSDFQCPACGSYYPLVDTLMKEASTSVRLVYRHFPLPQHQNAQLAARASEAAGKQGKFWEMYHALFEHQTDWSELSDPAARAMIAGYAQEMKLDMTVYTKDLDSKEASDVIDADQQGGTTIGVNSTPSFFVNGKPITPPSNYAEFKTLVLSGAK